MVACVVAACLLIVAPAVGAFGPLAEFGPPGTGPAAIGPHAPAVAVDAQGRVYVADLTDDRIEVFHNDGRPAGGWGALAGPSGVAAAPDGSIVVADRDGVHRYDPDGARLATLAGSGDAIGTPAGVAVGADGTVYVADPTHGRVVVLGGDDLGGLQRPIAVAVGSDASVYVVDAADARVHVFDADGAHLRSWAADDPRGIAVAPDGTLLVTDSGQGRVVRFDAGGAALGDFGREQPSRRLNVPRGVATDCRGRAYVVDNSSPRVHVFGDPGPPPPCALPVALAPPPPPPPPPPPVLLAASVPEPDPELGRTARATPTSGVVLVAQGNAWRRLRDREIVPVGSTVDTTDGRVKLELESAPGPDRGKYGRFMDGEFYGGAFTVDQKTTSSLVDLRLLDESGQAPGSLARAQKKKKRGLRVWGKARGRFRTTGRNGAATVRATEWLTSEQALGTLFRVKEGVIQVREFATGRTVTLHAGQEFLAKPACVSRRAFRIRLRVAPGATVRSAVVIVRGKRVAVRRGRRLTAPVDLRGAPEGVVTVRIRIRTADGRVVTGTRTYRTCRTTTTIPREPPPL